MLAEGLAGRRGPSLLFLSFQQDRHVRNQRWHSVLKPGSLCFQNALQHNEPLACLPSLKLFSEQRAQQDTAGVTTPAPTCPGQNGQLGALSQTDTTPAGAAFLWGIIQKNNLCSHPERVFYPELNTFSSLKYVSSLHFLSLHLPEINNYFFPQWSTNILQNAY